MIEILKRIYDEYFFKTEQKKQDILLSTKKNKEYYLTAQYTESEFLDFFNSNKTNEIIELFSLYKQEENDFKKNTSLIILVEVNDINEFYTRNKNQILSVEEDEYFFRKYVIIYSLDSIQSIQKESKVIQKIHEILLKEGKMDSFQRNLYKEEEYFLSIQLIVKLPFIKLSLNTKKFQSIEEKIKISLKKLELEKDAALVLRAINSENEETFDFEQLEKDVLIEEESKLLETFFDIFEVNNQ